VGKFDNLNDSQVPDILRRLARLETASPVNNTAIGRGGVTVYDGGVIDIENGGLIVNGTATIHGVLNADGTISFTGPVTIAGPLTITGTTNITGDVTSTGTFTNNGPTNLNGATKTTGTLSVEGVTTLKADLNVTTGKIKAGGLTVDPSASGGSIVFSGGGGVQGVSGVTAMKGAGNAGVITNNTAAVFAGASQLTVGDGYVTIDGLPTVSGVAANLYMDPSTSAIKRIV
jgi:hypothetical protein